MIVVLVIAFYISRFGKSKNKKVLTLFTRLLKNGIRFYLPPVPGFWCRFLQADLVSKELCGELIWLR